MRLSQHIINPNKVATSSDLSTGPYPIGMTVEKFLDLFSDVKSFDIDAVAILDTTQSQDIAASDILGALGNLDAQDNASNSSSFVDSTTRQVYPVGLLNVDGTETSPSNTPSSLVEYPIHHGGGDGGFITIDFGQTVCFADLLYPYIRVFFGNGMGSLEGGDIVGAVDFDGYGSIPIYGGGSSNGIDFAFAQGSISIGERYSSLRAGAIGASVGAAVTFSPSESMSDLQNYKTAYVGAMQVDVTATADDLTLTIPKYAKSGPVRFEANSPRFDSFLSYDELIIA